MRSVTGGCRAMPEPTLYLLYGYNLLHAGSFKDRHELVDTLASFVAGKGVRGVLVFDGVGEERAVGPLQVRYTAHADDLLERLAAENRGSENVCVVSSDHAVRWTSGSSRLASSSRSSRRYSTSTTSNAARALASATASIRTCATGSSASGAANSLSAAGTPRRRARGGDRPWWPVDRASRRCS